MNWLSRTITVAALAASILAVAPLVSAQGSTPSAEALYADATAKEAAVHKALADPDRQLTVLKAVRVVIADFEAVVRHYPASSYSDDALWHGGKLSRDAFEAFHDPHERTTALRLLQLLASDYPTSKLARRVPEEVAWLKAHQTLASTPLAAPRARPTAAPTHAEADTTKLVTVKDVRRTVLADTVRVVIELDSEVAFRDERLESPDRIFVDLPTTQVLATLADRTLRFDNDSDLVRQLRVGRQPNNTTRVVIEAAGVSSYSIYPLYSPFRLVIDCLRAKPTAARPLATTGNSAPTPTTPTAAAARVVASAPVRPVAPKPLPLLSANSMQAVLPLPGGIVLALPDVTPETATVEATPLPAPPAKSTPVPSAAAQASAASAAGVNGLSIARQLGLGVSRIVIDPGHGGHDPGAQASGITEADLTLDVALRVEKLLRKLPGVEVVLTRRDNSFIPLQERTAIANRENADLFLSIHANASSVPAARGIETYFLNFATNQGAAAVAARENAASGQSMGSLQDALKAIAFNSKLDESRDFAGNIQRELLEGVKPANKTVKDLGVKQAPFYVLIGASMPSVLAEISFITNPQEAKLLDSSAYRQRIAQALFDGVRKYQLSLRAAPSIAQRQQ